MNLKLFQRSPYNPLIDRTHLPVPASSVLNPGAVEFKGEILLLIRIEDEAGFSNIHVARSKNGVTDWKIDAVPLLEHGLPDFRYEQWGCEDARITYVAEDNTYYITYVAFSPNGSAVGLAHTRDFESVQRIGLIFGPSNKDAVMFSQKTDGKWWILHRPAAGNLEHIWSACSPDLIHWGMPHCIIPERGGPWWDGHTVGAGPPPILTKQGWLVIYHGVKQFGGNLVYRAGLALLDLDRPHKVIARCRGWVFEPEMHYETSGVTPNVVFPSGCVVRGDEVWMYYGAADTCICLATAKLSELLAIVEAEAAVELSV